MLGDDTPTAPKPAPTAKPKTGSPPPKTAAPATASVPWYRRNIIDPDKMLAGEEVWAGKQLGKLGSALQFPQQQVQGAITAGHPLAKTDPMKALRERVSGFLGDPGFEQRYESYPQPVRGLLDFGMQTVTDPLAALGAPIAGRSMLARGTEALEAHGLPAVVKAGQAIAKVPGGKTVTDALGKAHNYLGVHSAAKRALAAEHGPGWLDQYAQARARIMAAKAAEQRGLNVTPKVDPKIFDLMTQRERYTPSPLTRMFKVPQDFFTAGLFAQPFGHMANISALGALADPAAVVKALARGTGENARLVAGTLRGKPAETYAALDAENLARHTPAIRGGAVGFHPERDNPLDTGLSLAAQGASKIPLVGQALALIPKAARGLYRASGDILWKFDDEVKAQRFSTLVKGGMDPSRAGLRVGGELVDYENKSPIGRNLRPLAPFSTWRTKAPLATARNVVENPGRAAALSRGVPAVMGGSQGSEKDSGKPFTSSLPGSELNELATNPAKYAMGSVGAAPRLTLDLAGAIAGASRGPAHTRRQAADAKKLRTFMTYGQEPSAFALNELPLYGQALQLSGHGMFQHEQQPDWLTNLLSQVRVHP